MTDERDGSSDDDCEPPKKPASDPKKPLSLSPEIVKLAAWSPQESKGLRQITTRLVRRRAPFWIEALLIGLLVTWLYDNVPSLRDFINPVAVKQPSTDDKQPSTDDKQPPTDEE